MATEAISKWGKIDILIANAGKFVNAIIKGIKNNKAIVVIPSVYFLLSSLNNTFARLTDWFYRKFKIEGVKIDEKI